MDGIWALLFKSNNNGSKDFIALILRIPDKQFLVLNRDRGDEWDEN